jgi:ribosome maturation factor RimP
LVNHQKLSTFVARLEIIIEREHFCSLFLLHPMDLIEKIRALLLEKFETDELFADCFILEIALRPGNRLEVTLDSDDAVTFQKCQKLSRHLEASLDEQGWLGESYVLEVGSAGLTRVFEYPRQYVKNIGRDLKVKLTNGEQAEGEIIAADDLGVTLKYEEVRKEGKKKIKEMMTPKYLYSDIKEAKIKVKF